MARERGFHEGKARFAQRNHRLHRLGPEAARPAGPGTGSWCVTAPLPAADMAEGGTAFSRCRFSNTLNTRSSRIEPPLPPSWVIRRGRSGIHGHGVYACVAIPAGYVIVEYRGERITKAESARREAARLERVRRGLDGATYVFRLNARHDLDARRWGNISRYINHSCAPNCRAEKHRGRIFIIAENDIAQGEEVTFDYCYRFRHWAANPCRCGAATCVGYIVAESQRWRLRGVVPKPRKRRSATDGHR